MEQVFLGRQPIFTADLNVFAYELLFRSGTASNTAQVRDGDHATASVVMNLLTEIGLERVVDDKLAFINVTRNLLLNADLSCLPPERIVLEVLEDIEPDAEVIAAVERLSAAGFTIALDDIVYRQELEPLIAVANIIKVDLPQIPPHELAHHTEQLRRPGVKLLVEKVETQQEMELCRELGFHYFQGYFFCKPQILSERRAGGNQLSVMRLLAELQDPAITPEKVEDLLRLDPAMSFQVLRFVNSSANALNQKVESIRHATVILGIQRIRSLASMMALASAGQEKPRELLLVALTRARLCELLAARNGQRRTDQPFTVGLLSVLDAVLDRPMEEVVGLLPLASEVNEALLERRGMLGELLNAVIAVETTPAIPAASEPGQVTIAAQEYLDAVSWAHDCLKCMA